MFFNKFNFLLKDFTAKGEQRPEITGVFITPQKTMATDTFRLLMVDSVKGDKGDYPVIPNRPIPRDNFKPFILPSDKAGDVFKLFKKRNDALPMLDNAVITRQDKESVEISKVSDDLVSETSITSKVIDGRFPEVKDLLVERGRYAELHLDPKLLKDIVGFFSNFIDGDRPLVMRIPLIEDKISPVIFKGERKETGQTAKALLMPKLQN